MGTARRQGFFSGQCVMAEPIACPNCQQPLHVPENLFGQTVQCPDCQHLFQANRTDSAVYAGSAPAAQTQVTTEPFSRDKLESEEVRSEEGENIPRRRRYEEDDDDDDDDYRTLRWGSRFTEPHRAGMIMTMGILSIFIVPLVFGTIAWVMGNADLKKMEEGRMDPTGKSQTYTGRTIGMVMVILNLTILILSMAGMCVFFTVMLSVGA
jgi:hypothetical protein